MHNRQHIETQVPLVSIGMPIYNAAVTLRRAIESLLGQGYQNIELLISDNASTDATESICKEYAAIDKRVFYIRSDRNMGSGWNFNRVFELSSGKYFMWAAHDDKREPSFVSVCVEKMEQCPEAVLCHTHTVTFIEGRKEMLYVANMDSFEGVTGLVARYRETLKRFPAVALYGLYRSSAMRKTRMFQKAVATDMAFIQEMSIQGKFVQVPKALFNYFIREKWNTIDQDYRAIFGKEKKPWWYLPFVVLFCNHFKRVAYAKIPFYVKLQLWWCLIENQICQLALKVVIKLSGRLCPSRWKEGLGKAIYWRWMHNPNVKVVSVDLFREREIKPRLGSSGFRLN